MLDKNIREKIIFFILYIGFIFLIGCSCKTNIFLETKKIYIDINNTLYLAYENHKYEENGIVNYAKLVDNIWINIEKTQFEKNKPIIENIDISLNLPLDLPRIIDIENTTNILLENSIIKYVRYIKDGLDNNKTFIASVGVNQKSIYEDYEFSKIYYFAIIKKNDNWDMYLIHQIDNSKQKLTTYYLENSIFSDSDLNSKNMLYIIDIERDITYNHYLSNISYLGKENNKIVIKKLFGDFYPLDYIKVISSFEIPNMQETYSLEYFFDFNDSLHILYGSTKDETLLEYFLYKRDNPLEIFKTQELYLK